MLILLLPMLLFTRRFKTILGFLTGAVFIALITTAFEGFNVWLDFIRAIQSFGSSSVGVKNPSFLPLAMFVDLTSFSSHIRGGRSWPGLLIFVGSGLLALTYLVKFWLRARTGTRHYNNLLLAATLTWTLLINIYVPIYDSILVVLSVLITAGVFREVTNKSIYRCFTVTWILILVCSWFSVPLSRITGVQILTLLFAVFGVLQLIALSKLKPLTSSLPGDA
jgi:hypothetical protein